MTLIGVRQFIAVILMLWFSMPVYAETIDAQAVKPSRYAILVGAWKYPNLESRRQLLGPKNDVELVRQVLLQSDFKPGNIRVLSDEVSGAERPTRQAILDSLEQMTERLKPNDFVYLHFAGHGSQQPAKTVSDSNQEPDGLDEIFLPADVGRWNGETGSVERAITDDEIGLAIAQMRSKGAFIWIVFDSCHSGTMTRAKTPAGVRDRYIDPRALGIPAHVLETARAQAFSSTADATLVDIKDNNTRGGEGGQWVAFYAARSFETTPEMPLPSGAEDNRPHGLFTYSIMESLQANANASYRQIGQHLHALYATKGIRRPIPVFEGSGLDMPVFATSPEQVRERLRQWPVVSMGNQIRVEAGRLHWLGEGTVLAVVPNPKAGNSEALGCIQISQAHTLSSKAVGVEFPWKEGGRESCPALAAGQIEKGAYARLLNSTLPFKLGIAFSQDGAADEETTRVQRIVDMAVRHPQAQPFTQWVPAAEADVLLTVMRGADQNKRQRLWFGPPSGGLITEGAEAAYSMTLDRPDQELAQAIAQVLAHIAKSTNLIRISLVAQQPEAIGLEVIWFASEGERMADGACDTKGEKHRIDPEQLPEFGDCDRLEFELLNKGTSPLDITLLALDSGYGIAAVFPFENELNRLPSQGRLVIPPLRVNAKSTGIERLLVIAVKGPPRGVPLDFTYVAQNTLPAKFAAARGGEGGQLLDLMARAGFGQASTRSAGSPSPATLDRISVQIFSWVTVAR